MSNKIEQYLFVYNEKDGTFPEKWKVVQDNDTSKVPPEINGHIKKEQLEGTREVLKKQYPDEHYVVHSAYANSWDAVRHNYRGLFYDHFSSENTVKKTSKPDLSEHFPFTTKINEATQQGCFFILILFAVGVIKLWNTYLELKSISSTFAWLYILIFYQPYSLLSSIHIPIIVGICIYILLRFSYLLLIKINIDHDGLTILPIKRFIRWGEIEDVYIDKLSDEYDKMPLFGYSLIFITKSGKRYSLSNRFNDVSLMVKLIEHQIKPHIIKRLEKKISQGNFVDFSKNVILTKNNVTFKIAYDIFRIDYSDISKVHCDRENLEIYDLENKLVYVEEVKNMKNAIFIEPLIKKLKHKIVS